MTIDPKKKTILVAPLHWGLGHATRCIPIINTLLENNYNVLLASDGGALALLQKEFPQLDSIELPSYDITYPKDGLQFRRSMILKLPHIKATIIKEKRIAKELVENETIDGIISDNRLGVYNKKVPSVYITHQIKVLSGNTTFFSSKLHQKTIKKFDVCWVPDFQEKPNLSGKLGHPKKTPDNIVYIGPLSRFSKKETKIKRDILVVLSGPEPQRTILEEKLTLQLVHTDYSVLLIQGIVKDVQQCSQYHNIKIINYLTSTELNDAILSSDRIICRSGYTTLMDLSVLNKKAFLIPTPGQFEQEYLAKRLDKKNRLPSSHQDDFKISELQKLTSYKGLKKIKSTENLAGLLTLFERE